MSIKHVKLIAVSAFALFQISPALAQTTPSSQVAAQQRTATPALWVVKDADTTIYLFGTFHALPDGLNWNYGPVKAAFESADLLKLEIATLNSDMPEIQSIIAQKGRLPEGQKLTDGLSDAQKGELTRIIGEAGMPPAALENMRPWMVSIVLSAALIQKMGMDPSKGVDKTLDTLARSRNIPVEGFETAAQQIGFLADFDAPTQRAVLLSTLEDWDQTTKLINDMIEAWSTGNANRIDRLISGSLRSQPMLAQVLLTDRNRRWADWIGTRMATPGTVFIAVGAGHLVGRDSVQSFLRTKGLRATRVSTRVGR
jgi:uncharacterized protein